MFDCLLLIAKWLEKNFQLEKTNQCKDARALKEPEGCRVDAPQQLN